MFWIILFASIWFGVGFANARLYVWYDKREWSSIPVSYGMAWFVFFIGLFGFVVILPVYIVKIGDMLDGRGLSFRKFSQRLFG